MKYRLTLFFVKVGIHSKTCSVDRKSHGAFVKKKSRPKSRSKKKVRAFFRKKVPSPPNPESHFVKGFPTKRTYKHRKNMHFLDFSDFRRDVYCTHGRHSGSFAMPLAEVIHEVR